MVLVGMRTFAKKDGSGFFYVVNYIKSLTDKEVAAGSFGRAVGENFVDREVFDMVKKEDIGRDFSFDFMMGATGKPCICGIRFSAPVPEGAAQEMGDK